MALSIKGLCYEATLTYPSSNYPDHGRELLRHWDAIRRWICSHGVGGVRMTEFKGDRPHIHLLLTGPLDKAALATRWTKIVGSGDPNHALIGATIRPIWRNDFAAINYLAKQEDKVPPQGFGDVGRFWSKFGALAFHPVEVIEGDRAEMNQAIRVLRNVEDALRRSRDKRKVIDNGQCSRTVRHSAAQSIKRAARRLVEASDRHKLRLAADPSLISTERHASDRPFQNNMDLRRGYVRTRAQLQRLVALASANPDWPEGRLWSDD